MTMTKLFIALIFLACQPSEAQPQKCSKVWNVGRYYNTVYVGCDDGMHIIGRFFSQGRQTYAKKFNFEHDATFMLDHKGQTAQVIFTGPYYWSLWHSDRSRGARYFKLDGPDKADAAAIVGNIVYVFRGCKFYVYKYTFPRLMPLSSTRSHNLKDYCLPCDVNAAFQAHNKGPEKIFLLKSDLVWTWRGPWSGEERSASGPQKFNTYFNIEGFRPCQEKVEIPCQTVGGTKG